MDDQRLGAVVRSVRVRRGWRQEDLAEAAGLSRASVSRIERGHAGSLSLDTVRRVCGCLDIRLDLVPRWRGGELDRLLNSGHSAMHERLARALAAVPGWQWAPEVSFSVFGERGMIDVLAWHPTCRMLLVIELKTEIVDMQELLGTIDRKRRLALQIARDRDWAADQVACWLLVADGVTNRRRAAAHGALLRSFFPADGRRMRRWLRHPAAPLGALSFLSIAHPRNAKSSTTTRQRVRKRAAASGHARRSTAKAATGAGRAHVPVES